MIYLVCLTPRQIELLYEIEKASCRGDFIKQCLNEVEFQLCPLIAKIAEDMLNYFRG